MTLVIAIPAVDGIVFASDGQVTTGPVKATITKINPLNDNALWAASGELALIQRVADRISTLPDRNQPLEALRDRLAEQIKMSVEELLQLDFRTRFFSGDPDKLLSLHQGDFLFVEHRGAPRVLHILPNGTPEWIDGRIAATGSGDMFAHALLQKYADVPLDCDVAALVAYKVIEEVIEVGSYGLGPPIDVWVLSARGVRQYDEGDIAALEDLARLLRDREIELLGQPGGRAIGLAAPQLPSVEEE